MERGGGGRRRGEKIDVGLVVEKETDSGREGKGHTTVEGGQTFLVQCVNSSISSSAVLEEEGEEEEQGRGFEGGSVAG